MTIAASAYPGRSSSDPSCDAIDVACLKNLAVQTIIGEIKENDPRNHGGAGERYFELKGFLDADEVNAAQIAINTAGPSEQFWRAHDQGRDDALARESMNYAGVRDGILGHGYPKTMRWDHFIGDAIAMTINGSDADLLVDLYLEETALFAEYAERASGAIITYMARAQIETVEQFGANPDTPKNTLYRSLDELGYVAAQTCLEGDITLGNRIIAFRDTHAQTQQYSEELAFLPLVSRFNYILACEGEAQAMIEFSKIEEGLENVPNGEIILKDGLTLSVDRMRSDRVMDSVVRPLAYHLLDTGRENEARALFSRYIAPSVEIGYDLTTGSPITATNALEHPHYAEISEVDRANIAQQIQERLDYEWERDLEIRAQQDLYSNDAAVRMDYFTSRFDPKFEICCTDGQHVEDMIEEIEAASRYGLVSGEIIARAVELSERAKAADQKPGTYMPAVLVKLATIEKSRGCALAETRLNILLTEIETLEHQQWQFEDILAMIEYNCKPRGARLDDVQCAIQ